MEDLQKKGYSQEEEYFFRQNQKLIEQKRKEYDSRKPSNEGKAHWMKCPKCDTDLKETDLAGIKVDQCQGCQGLYFDAGELEILLQSKEPKGFISGLKRLLS